jgi:predicted metal-binding protein
MSQRIELHICNSHKASIHGGGCCNDKNATQLIQSFREALPKHQLEHQIEIVESPCLRSCPHGISLFVPNQKTMLGGIKITDVDEILTCLSRKQALPERLVVDQSSKMKFS